MAGYAEWTQWLHPDDLARTESELRQALVSGTDFSSEFRAVWPDGCVRFIRAAGRISLDSHQRVHRMTGVNWDVTPQRELNARLAEQHELLRVTLNSIGDAVITTDAKSQVTWLNPAAERMTGWTSADAIGRPLSHVFHIVHEESRVPMDNPVSACLASGKVAGLAKHTLLISRDDQEFGIEDSAAPIRGPDGEILGVVMVFHDVTEQRRMSGEMSYRATHDPLTGLV
ncbi:PAS domain-containing protein, partial [Escherichia coli]|uniref:PAS domain-containing protein n=1 Tax=Escherichia coli TaxID=562 RepID=UPI0032646443